MQTHLPPGIELVQAENFDQWLIDIRVLDSNPLYQDQIFRLKLTFSSKYPIGMALFSDRPSKKHTDTSTCRTTRSRLRQNLTTHRLPALYPNPSTHLL